MESSHQRDIDPLLSTRILIETCYNVKPCFNTEYPFSKGFITTLGERVCCCHECAGRYIGSTYMTNSSKLELFSILTGVFGTGFPVAYLLQVPGSGAQEENKSTHVSILTGFNVALYNSIPHFRPKFFFSDKYSGQIKVIESGYGKSYLFVYGSRREQ